MDTQKPKITADKTPAGQQPIAKRDNSDCRCYFVRAAYCAVICRITPWHVALFYIGVLIGFGVVMVTT
jgi:hypothetical protein